MIQSINSPAPRQDQPPYQPGQPVALFIPCYIDQFYPQVGLATVEVLERHRAASQTLGIQRNPLDLEHHFPAARGFRRLDRPIVIIQAKSVRDHRGHVYLA